MKEQKHKLRTIYKRITDYNIHWIIITVRLIFVILSFACNIAVRKLLCPLIPFWNVKRYIESVVNMLSMRFILMMIGFFRYECEGFMYFRKGLPKITLKSGFIGIGTHHSIIDYIYYSYIFNPVFVKVILYKKEDKEETLYCPLSFIQSICCAIDNRGFKPIIVRSEMELKRIKYRKMNMKTLVSQCFEQVKGPIFIMLPGLSSEEHIKLNNQISYDIFENQLRFERNLVAMYVKVDKRLRLNEQTYKNQLFFMLDQMCRFCSYSMQVGGIEFNRRMKYQVMRHHYDRVTFSTFVDKHYQDNGFVEREIDYEAYEKEMDQLQLKYSNQRLGVIGSKEE